jgi:imidazolonepropionase
MTSIVVHSASQFVVGPADGEEKGLETHADGAVAIENGTVAKAGPTEAVCRAYPPANADRAIDATGKTVIPGFVDPHTHALFVGDRSDEFVARIEGQTYTEIMDAGGGITATVDAVREASDETLLDSLQRQLDTMLAHGTTTAEVKTGYGLDTETELQMLDVIRQADQSHPVDLVPTFLGAHAVPEGMEADEYTGQVVDEQLPAVAEQGIAEFCDVFCESGVFDVEQSRRILTAGREHGLEPKIHAEEFSRIGGAELAAELEAVSADHLLAATAEDADRLREAGVVPTFLPATALSLGEAYADPSAFLDGPVALGTDLNPACFVHSMGMVTSLACMGMGLRPERAIRGATRDAALAIDRSDGTGTLAEGTAADLAVVDLPSATHIPYNAGTNRVETVCKDGEVVVENSAVVGADS